MNIKKWVIAVALCVAALAGLAYFKVSEISAGIAAAESYPEPSETVEVARVTVSEHRAMLAIVGEVVAPQRLDLRNELDGEITAVTFASGEPVAEGQVLVQMDVAIEEANLQAARARADLAQLVFRRNEELFESKVSNADQLDRARADLTAARAQISALERAIAKKTLRAPFAGRAGLHNFEVGQFLESNTLIANLVGNTDFMWIDFQVPQFYGQLPAGAEVGVTLIDDSDDANRKVTATVIAESTIMNARNRSRSYRARVPGGNAQYVANSMVNVEVPTGTAQRLLRVPSVAVQNDSLGQFVYVLHDDESGSGYRAKRQRVVVTLLADDRALLENNGGLAEGDRVAAAGAFKLYDGMLVHAGERGQSETGHLQTTPTAVTASLER